jgi:hypothetical protein
MDINSLVILVRIDDFVSKEDKGKYELKTIFF